MLVVGKLNSFHALSLKLFSIMNTELVVLVKNLFTTKLSVTFVIIFLLLGGIAVFVWQVNRTVTPDFVSDEAQTNQEATPEDDFSQDVLVALPVPEAPRLIAGTMEAQVANLQKLAMVWGFTKYTHLVFLAGERCWDEELLGLIPIVRFAAPEDVNDILYNWFVGLGDAGHDNSGSVFLLARTNEFLSGQYFLALTDFLNTSDDVAWLSRVSIATEASYHTIGLRVDKDYFEVFVDNAESFSWLYSLEIVDKGYLRHLTDMNWLTCELFLGSSIVAVFSQFNETPVVDRARAPVSFNIIGNSNFSNQSLHTNMDFQDAGYRLLGLFRLWNALKYFSPYIDIIDGDWNEILLKYIPIMLEGDDRLSYELTLMALASHLHDAHVFFSSTLGSNRHNRFDSIFGRFAPPVILTEAEGHLVVFEQIYLPYYEHRLLPGDVVLRVNDVDIDDVAADMLQYISYPNEEKALFYLEWYLVLRQHSPDVPMKLDILRDDVKITLEVETIDRREHGMMTFIPEPPATAYERLENNIGLINPSTRIQEKCIQHIMQYFYDTSGLIVDLRQYPHTSIFQLAGYLIEEPKHFVSVSTPSQSVPGVFIDLIRDYSGGMRETHTYLYQNNVVILMNEGSMSRGEHAVMSLRNGSNVTVMGSNSIGANGNVVSLPLPGRVTMNFSGLGIFTPDGNQTQRVGLSPDIYINRTIAGIRDGRDELLEAAVEFLMGNPFQR